MAERAKKVPVKELDQLEAPDLLEQMIATGIKPKGGDAGRERAQQILKTFVAELLDPGMVVQKGVMKTINARIAMIDELLSKQVNAILVPSGDHRGLDAPVRRFVSGCVSSVSALIA